MLKLLCSAACLVVCSATGMTCMGEDGSAVDWWVAFKVPGGTNYMYGDSRKAGIKASTHDMGSSNVGALATTVSQIYNQDTDKIGFVLYNDQDPNAKKNDVHGHTKGVVGMNSEGGFWLIHSVPKFPDFTDGPYTGFGSASITYGQSFFCQTLSLDELNDVGSNWLYSRPNVYDWNLPEWVPQNIVDVVLDGKCVRTPGGTQIKTYTAGSLSVTHFAKNVAWNDQIWPNLIAPHWKLAFNVETWMNGRNPDEPDCNGKYAIQQIASLKMADWAWSETQDHSKWGISITGSVVCIGDINRQASQATRAGGYACFKNAALHKALAGFIVRTNGCNTKATLTLLDDSSVVPLRRLN